MPVSLITDFVKLDATHIPVLYSFRRCPYAMRARMGIFASGMTMDFREVVLRDKPEHMVEISPKATVPVVQLPDGTVVDESLDVMFWALGENDPLGWLGDDLATTADMKALIAESDDMFKYHLDRYKYANRHEGADADEHRDAALVYLRKWDQQLSGRNNLFSDKPLLADYAIFPFVRQFANVDRDWFNAQDIPELQTWLQQHLISAIFVAIMAKQSAWRPGDTLKYFPFDINKNDA